MMLAADCAQCDFPRRWRRTAHRKVPASMRSGMTRCVAPCRRSHAVDDDAVRAVALDARAHLDQQFSQIDDFGFARDVFQHRAALGQR